MLGTNMDQEHDAVGMPQKTRLVGFSQLFVPAQSLQVLPVPFKRTHENVQVQNVVACFVASRSTLVGLGDAKKGSTCRKEKIRMKRR